MQQQNLYEQKLALVMIDVLAFFCALHAAIFLRYGLNLPFGVSATPPWREIFLALPWVLGVWIIINAVVGSYHITRSRLDEVAALVRGTLITFLAVLSATFFYRGFSYSRGMIGFLIPLVLVFVVSGRLLFRVARRRVLMRFAGRCRVAILGRTQVGESLITALRANPDYYDVVGTIASGEWTSSALKNPIGAVPLLGHLDQLESLLAQHNIHTLILVDRGLSEQDVLYSMEICMRRHVHWNLVPAVYDLLLDRVRVGQIDGIPLVGMRYSNIVGFNWLIKRVFDVVMSLVLLLIGAPLMIGVAIAIRLSSKGPVLYSQDRVGYRGQVFSFIKFRSMHLNNDDAIHRAYTRQWIQDNAAHSQKGGAAPIHKIVDDPRIFPVGRFIRKYSIDELPQLFNVLRGEMSLIGPRPALPYEVDVYREWHRRRFEAPPGITGLWQVSGRNRLSFEEMIKLDIEYLENWSLLRDLHILWRTIRVVLFEHAY